jgi:hypothetical protein
MKAYKIMIYKILNLIVIKKGEYIIIKHIINTLITIQDLPIFQLSIINYKIQTINMPNIFIIRSKLIFFRS